MKKLICMALSIGLMLSVVACNANATKPEDSLSKMLDAYKAEDTSVASALLGENASTALTDNDEKNKEIALLLMKNVSYKILSTDVKDDTATIEMEITNVDMKEVMKAAIQKAVSSMLTDNANATVEKQQELIYQYIKEEIVANKDKTVTNKVSVKMVKTGSDWQVQPEEKLVNALTGGMLDIASNLSGLQDMVSEPAGTK